MLLSHCRGPGTGEVHASGGLVDGEQPGAAVPVELGRRGGPVRENPASCGPARSEFLKIRYTCDLTRVHLHVFMIPSTLQSAKIDQVFHVLQ